MGLKDVAGLEKSAGMDKVPSVSVPFAKLNTLPPSQGLLVDVMFSVVRRCIVAQASKVKKTVRPQLGPGLFAVVLLYQQALRAIWAANGRMPKILALCFDRSSDKEMKRITTIRREARHLDATVTACAAGPANACPNKDVTCQLPDAEDVYREIRRTDTAWRTSGIDTDEDDEVTAATEASPVRLAKEKQVDVEAFMRESLHADGKPSAPDTRNVVYQFLDKMYEHLTSMHDVPVPLLLSQGDAYLGSSASDNPNTSQDQTRGLLQLPSMCLTEKEQSARNQGAAVSIAVRVPESDCLFVCMCQRASDGQPVGLAISVTPLVDVLCTLLDKMLWVENAAVSEAADLVKTAVQLILQDSWICEHTRASLNAVMDSIVAACVNAERLRGFQQSTKARYAASYRRAIIIAEHARVGEAEILVARILTLLTGTGDAASRLLGQALLSTLDEKWAVDGTRSVYTVESIDSDFKILCNVNAEALQQTGIRLICSPKMNPGGEWWDLSSVVRSLRLDVIHTLLRGLMRRVPAMRDVQQTTLHLKTPFDGELFNTDGFRTCILHGVRLWTAMPALLGQDCVPDWLSMTGASYKSLRQACSNLFWGAAVVFEEKRARAVDVASMGELEAFFLAPQGAGLFDADGSVSLTAFAAVCALTAAITPNYILFMYDSIIGASKRPEKRKRGEASGSGSGSESLTEEIPPSKRKGSIGNFTLAECTHLVVRTPRSQVKRCKACERVLIYPVHHKFGETIGAGDTGRMPDELMERMVRSSCTPLAEGGGRRGQYGNFMAGITPETQATVLRQIVVCAATLHRGYKAYVGAGKTAPVHSLDGSLTYPGTLIGGNGDREQAAAVRQILARIATSIA